MPLTAVHSFSVRWPIPKTWSVDRLPVLEILMRDFQLKNAYQSVVNYAQTHSQQLQINNDGSDGASYPSGIRKRPIGNLSNQQGSTAMLLIRFRHSVLGRQCSLDVHRYDWPTVSALVSLESDFNNVHLPAATRSARISRAGQFIALHTGRTEQRSLQSLARHTRTRRVLQTSARHYLSPHSPTGQTR